MRNNVRFLPVTATNVYIHTCIQGTWEKKIVERVHKAGKKRGGTPSSGHPAKRGRPKQDNLILQRYPPLHCPVDASEDILEALRLDLEKHISGASTVHFVNTFSLDELIQ